MRKQKNKSKNKKLANFIIIFLILALAAYVLATFFSVYIDDPFHFSQNFSIELLKRKMTAPSTFLTAIIIFAVFAGIVIWYSVKHNLFSFSKILNRVDRAQSNLYGGAEMMQRGQVKEKYGNYSFRELAKTDAHGILVRSEKNRGELYCSAVGSIHGIGIGTNGVGKSWYCLCPTIQFNAQTSYKPTMVINDLKGELYKENSALLEAKGYRVVCINMRTPRNSLRCNPLSLVWTLYHQYLDTNDSELLDRVSAYIVEIAEILCPSGSGENKVWADGSQGIVAGILWGMLEDSADAAMKETMTEDKFTFTQLSNILNRQREYLIDFLTHRPVTSKVFDYASMIIGNDSEKTVSSYISNTQTSLKAFLDTGIQYLTSASDWDITTITKQPTAVFLIIPDENPTRWVLSTLIISQIYNYLTLEASMSAELKLERTCYFLLDEFGNLPKIPRFPNWVATSRGRQIFFFPLIQAISQLKSVYGENDAKTILDNCHLKIFLGANEVETFKYFQDLFGNYTVYQRSASINGKDSIDYSGTTGMTKKELVTLDELQYIQAGTLYFIVRGEAPALSHYVPLFDEEMNEKGIYKRGAVSEKITEKKIDFEKSFYDLKDREERYIMKQYLPPDTKGGGAPIEVMEEEDEESLDIVDTTMVYQNAADREELTHEVRTLNDYELNDVLGFTDSAADDFIGRLKENLL